MLKQLMSIVALTCQLSQALPSGFKKSSYQGVSHGITDSAAAVENRTFDYIVCGGGLTGLTVASRLTENPNITVLVIENGYDNHTSPMVNDVRTYGQAFTTDLDFGFESTPISWQNNSTLSLVAGRMLGGSGGLNGASWTKGAKSQYDLLRNSTGDDSWGFDAFNEHMLAAENFHIPAEAQHNDKGADYDSHSHGRGGPVQVSFGADMYGGTQLPALEASENLWSNLTRNTDASSGHVNGATIIPNMVYVEDSQNRSSPFTAYAEQQIQQTDNFLILTGHRVTEIVWKQHQDGQELIADGVHFQASRNSSLQFAKATREVLLSAGSLQSPQILELSGVGDPDVLNAAGVEVKLPLKGVGKNLQEQTKNSLYYSAKEGIDFDGTGPPSAISFLTAQQLLGNASSAWYSNTSSGLASYASSLKEAGLVANANATQQIMQYQVENIFRASDSAAAEVFFTIDLATAQVGIDNWNLIVLSRGTAHIQSNSSWDHPIVEPSYFDHPLDLALQTALNQQSREVYSTEPLASYVTSENTPGLDVLPVDATTKDWENWVKSSFTSVWHYIATLSMMKKEYGGVVDSRLKVYGIKNVRAVDASIVPIQLSAHLSSSLYGIAEKAASMIQDDQ